MRRCAYHAVVMKTFEPRRSAADLNVSFIGALCQTSQGDIAFGQSEPLTQIELVQLVPARPGQQSDPARSFAHDVHPEIAGW